MTLDERNKAIMEVSPYPRLDIAGDEKPDLFEYIEGLPDVDMELAPLEDVKEDKVEGEAEVLVEFIRKRAKASHITSFGVLLSENEGAAAVLEKVLCDENFDDIVEIKGTKESYYYSNQVMTDSFAKIAVLVHEKDYPSTVAHVVRDRSKYPSPTPVKHFVYYPYFYSAELLSQIRETLKDDPNYQDIKEFKLDNGMEYFYSNISLEHRLAVGLAEDTQPE